MTMMFLALPALISEAMPSRSGEGSRSGRSGALLAELPAAGSVGDAC